MDLLISNFAIRLIISD